MFLRDDGRTWSIAEEALSIGLRVFGTEKALIAEPVLFGSEPYKGPPLDKEGDGEGLFDVLVDEIAL